MLQGRNKKDKERMGRKNFYGKRRKESKDRRKNYMLKIVVISSEAVRETCKIVFRAGRTPRDHSSTLAFFRRFLLPLDPLRSVRTLMSFSEEKKRKVKAV